ncbi:hypothetical protein EJ03DRAFT_342384 [Teratosphaeria nubilosa]|uniref:Dynamin family protein n=1 Tax=Teratosphaeria nubilosa TaxID=161662 RepID=A0A6G1LGR0_9PEZI|nr:hypothetical protein EJ03DRAFT_342384 [Teratosphaeria nubilosa]
MPVLWPRYHVAASALMDSTFAEKVLSVRPFEPAMCSPVSGKHGLSHTPTNAAGHQTKQLLKRQQIQTSSLDGLQNKESRKVMDVVDKLRRSGLSGIIHLPQLVVSGDQSSGKSSVLEAITEIPFPRKENLCTRFATEIILRRANMSSIVTSIIPDKVRPDHERKRLEDFKDSIEDFTQLPTLMEKATELMGLGGDNGSIGAARAFSRDVLRIEIAGPGRPHLTLVDLPGLIHSENKMQTKEDVELIRTLVDEYISNKRTIVMAMVSAKNDYANQIILKKCRDFDPKGQRTIGIITKPDFLEPGSENEQSWIELTENKDIFFELGWHMLKNRSDKEAAKSFDERNAAEHVFFSQGRYRDLPRDNVGIEALRTRLSSVLYKHLQKELPALQKELNEKHRQVCHDLKQLGEKRSTPGEQRRFMMGVSTTYQDIVKAAVNGQYEHEFFGDIDPDAVLDDEANMRRLRAVVQYLNLQFASTMRQYGHAELVEPSEDEDSASPKPQAVSEPELDEGYTHFSEIQKVVTRADAVTRVRKILIRSRGRELPGSLNPLLISHLFWTQSANWKDIAMYHIDRVASVCASFVRSAMDFSVSCDISERLQAVKVEAALIDRLNRAKNELDRIIADCKHHPITYDPAYTAIVQKTRHQKHSIKFEKLLQEAEVLVERRHDHKSSVYLQPDVIKTGMDTLLEPDMDKTSAEDALDSQDAYYKEEVKYFIAAVTKQVIERCLLRDLADETISPVLITDMTDEEIAMVAAEPEETTKMRENLEARKGTLEKGQQTFKSAIGLFR